MQRYMTRLLYGIMGGILFLSLSFLLPTISPAQNPSNNRLQTLIQADRLYIQGDTAGAEQLYRRVKPAFPNERGGVIPQPITDPAQLSPSGQVYWRTAQEGMAQGLESKIFEPLKLLVQQEPQFIPGHLLYYEALEKADRGEEAIASLEQAVSLFPDSIELNKALISALEEDNQWLEASIAARQFAIVNPEHPEAAQFTELADKDLGRFRDQLTKENVVQGVLGSVIGFVRGDRGARAIEGLRLLLQGESGLGSQFASAHAQQLTLVQDPEVIEYVTKMGLDLASLMGRDFDYEFYVVQDNSINASAFPGGKIFVHTGLILAANSEAELAGVMAHEVSHAVLSHGFQKMTQGNLLSNLDGIGSLGNLAANLLSLSYSRDKERQADIVGMRVLATAGYAADGLRNAFVTMKQQERSKPPVYLSSHPATEDRIRYIEALIQQNGYNRYAFEGAERHTQIQERLKRILSGQPVPSTPSEVQTAVRQPVPQPMPQSAPVPAPVQSAPSSSVSQPASGQSRSTVGDIALASGQQLNGVTIRFDGGRVSRTGSYEANVIVENKSARPFAFVPVFVKVENASGEPVQARFSYEDSNHTTAEPGETLKGRLQILGQRWQDSGSQGLTLVIREGTTGGRVFRILIQ